MKSVFEIVRRIPEKKALLRTKCLSGFVTVLVDEAADGILLTYQAALSGKESDRRFTFKLQGKSFDPSKQETIGFGERLPEASTIQEFLLDSGYREEEIEGIIEEYDLEQYSYLNCGALNATASRQLQLLRSLRSESPVLICNDPFLPFNGRWREDFAKLFVQAVSSSDKIIVVSNLSFMPQSWNKTDGIRIVDVGKAADRARKKAEEMAARKAAEKAEEAMREQLAEAAAEQVDEVVEKEATEHEIPTGIPENMVFAYRAANDYLFAPLARLSNALREYSGFALPASVFGVGLLVAVVMYPNLSGSKEKLQKLSRDVSWQDVVDATKSPAAVQSGENKNPNVALDNPLQSDARVVDEVAQLVAPSFPVGEQLLPKVLRAREDVPSSPLDTPRVSSEIDFAFMVVGKHHCELSSQSDCEQDIPQPLLCEDKGA